ncbi:MAG: oligosaccharide flippase family protein [Synergistes sp.]|nr:oligosaccharide flippase family protein [Synergistes sp.]
MNNKNKRGTSYLKALPAPVMASLAFILMSVVEKGLVLITSPIYTRLLTQSEFGVVSVFLSWRALLGIVATFSLAAGVFNNGMLDYREDRDGYSFSMLALSNIITLICMALLAALWSKIGKVLDFGLPLVVLMFLDFMLQPAFGFWMARQRFEYKYLKLSAIVMAYAVLSSAAAVICILIFPGHRIYARLFGGESVLLCVYLIFYIYLGVKAGWKVNTSYWKAAVIFNLPIIPHYLSGYVLNSADRIMIAGMTGSAAAARYSVAYTAALAVTIVWNAVNGSLVPYTYEKCRSGDSGAVRRVTKPVAAAYAFLCCVLILLAPELLKIMAPAGYYEAVYIIPPIVGGVFFMALYFLFGNVVYYHRKPAYVMLASAAAAALNIALNFIFIPRYGYTAAAYTTLFCYIVQAALDWAAMRAVTDAKIYDMRFMLMLSAGMTAFALFSGVLYRHDMLRYGTAATLLLLLFTQRRRIFEVMARLKAKNTALPQEMLSQKESL